MVYFFFIRHGETDYNFNKIIMGQLPVPLNSLGKSQSHLLGKLLKNIPVDITFSSDLLRAKETTDILLSYITSNDTRYLQGLRERSFGVLEGHPQSAVLHQYFDANSKINIDFKPANGESIREFSLRSSQTFEEIKRYSEETSSHIILVVTHAGTIQNILGSLFQCGRPEAYYLPLKLDNTSLTIVDYQNDLINPYQLVKANSTEHLGPFNVY